MSSKKDNPSSSMKSWIVGGTRTLTNLIPIAGGAIAQAWSEYETHKQNERVEEYFQALAQRLKDLGDRVDTLQRHIAQMPDAAELLERTVEAAVREVSSSKRSVYPIVYMNFLLAQDQTTPDERTSILDHIEHLTATDLNVLSKFGQQRALGGEVLTNSVDPGWGAVGGPKEPDDKWLQQHGDLVHSVTKLTSRGVITETYLNRGMATSGESASSFNRFRRKAWCITPIGRKLLDSLQTTK